jgi:hypothetical protein
MIASTIEGTVSKRIYLCPALRASSTTATARALPILLLLNSGRTYSLFISQMSSAIFLIATQPTTAPSSSANGMHPSGVDYSPGSLAISLSNLWKERSKPSEEEYSRNRFFTSRRSLSDVALVILIA